MPMKGNMGLNTYYSIRTTDESNISKAWNKWKGVREDKVMEKDSD